MSPEAQAILNEWSPPVTASVLIALVALVYLRGSIALRRSAPLLLSKWRIAAFLSSLFILWIAIGSPLSAFDESSLTVHMIQHLLLMLAVPPLLLLGNPGLPLLHGLPQWFVRTVLGPFLRLSWVQRSGNFLTDPVVCWLLAAVMMMAWHVPSAFELALRSDSWHEVEHACFLSTSILFWWPVVQPFPSQSRWSRWSIPVYLLFAMFPGGVLGAFLAFCDRVLYPSYKAAPRVFGLTPLEDQILAGVLMWVVGMFVFVVPAVFVTLRLLSPAANAGRHSTS